jgi:hypothetical protein
MIYENKEDREKQSEAVAILQKKWSNFKLVETPELFRLNFDFKIFGKTGLTRGVGEIKCRNYDMEFFKTNPWLVEIERIHKLNRENDLRGIPSVFVLYTKDQRVLYISVKEIINNLYRFDKAPITMMKDNHGTQDCDKTGVLVPFECLKIVEKQDEI